MLENLSSNLNLLQSGGEKAWSLPHLQEATYLTSQWLFWKMYHQSIHLHVTLPSKHWNSIPSAILWARSSKTSFMRAVALTSRQLHLHMQSLSERFFRLSFNVITRNGNIGRRQKTYLSISAHILGPQSSSLFPLISSQREEMWLNLIVSLVGL